MKSKNAFAVILGIALVLALLWPREDGSETISSPSYNVRTSTPNQQSEVTKPTSLEAEVAKTFNKAASARRLPRDPSEFRGGAQDSVRELSRKEIEELKLQDYEGYLRYQAKRSRLERGEDSETEIVTAEQKEQAIREVVAPKLLEQLREKSDPLKSEESGEQ